MTLKLHAFPLSPRGFKVLFAAHHLGLDYELAVVDFARSAQTTPQFTALNPNQRMPVLEEDGFMLWESNAIVQYLAAKKPESGLLPADLQARMTAVKWQFWEAAHWDPACAIFMFENVVKKLFRGVAGDPAEVAKGVERMAVLAPILDGQLGKTRYVAGDTLTVADISLGATLVSAELAQMPLEPYRGIARWITELRALPGWRKAAALMQPPA